MAEKPKPKVADEEAHFRIDEHERRLEGIEKATAPDNVAAVAQGAVATLAAQLEKRLQEQLAQVTERLVKAVREDVESDRAVVKTVGELVSQIGELVKELRTEKPNPMQEGLTAMLTQLGCAVQALHAPATRTGTIELPTGKATICVRETRD